MYFYSKKYIQISAYKKSKYKEIQRIQKDKKQLAVYPKSESRYRAYTSRAREYHFFFTGYH